MAELENIASELLKSANEADLNYKKTRDQSQKDKATRLRVIVQNLKTLTLGASDLNGLTDVTLSSIANLNGLVYNSSTGQWENEAIVNKIIAGANISLSPPEGTGNVTINTLHTGGLYSQTQQSVPVTTSGSLIDGGVGTLTVPANGFQVGDSFNAYLSGQITSANNEQISITIMAGAVTLAASGTITLPATTNKNWELYITFTIRIIGSAGTASIATAGTFFFNKDASNAPESVGFFSQNNTTFNTTISNTLQVNVQWLTVNPANTIHSDLFNLNRVY
tara:strand:- start:49 stop:885 length:837 start_codon:yes stop_codon:yes gene_type:complete